MAQYLTCIFAVLDCSRRREIGKACKQACIIVLSPIIKLLDLTTESSVIVWNTLGVLLDSTTATNNAASTFFT